MLKASESTKYILQLRKSGVEVFGDGKAKYDCKYKFHGLEISSTKVDGSKVKDDKVAEDKNYQKIFKSKKLSKFKKTVEFLNFFFSEARLVLIKLRQAFVKTLILYYFD